MLDDYKIEQSIAYKIIKNSVENKKISHAFIIEANGYQKVNQFVIALSKSILCPKNYTNNQFCFNCNQCYQIEKNEFVELKIIEPESAFIKKEKIENIQDEFSKKAIIGNKKVYIINDASKLNKSSANTILKFLEEPEEGIYAILVVDNINEILDTIVSRCQVIKLNNNSNNLDFNELLYTLIYNLDNRENINIDNYEEQVDKIVNFVEKIESFGLDTLNYTNKYLDEIINDKNDMNLLFYVILLFYNDVIKFKLNRDQKIFPGKYFSTIEKVSNLNSIYKISNKIKKILDLKSKIKFNANDKLLIDRLILELGGE